MSPTRYHLLKLAGAVASATIALESIVGCSTPENSIEREVTPSPVVTTLEDSIGWSFLERLPTVGSLEAAFVMENYVPLGPESELNPDSEQFSRLLEDALPVLQPSISDWSQSDISFVITQQVYGVPENAYIAQEMVDYAKKAEEFLKQKIRGLDNFDVHWAAISSGDNYSDEFNGRGFIGKHYYFLTRIKAIPRGSNTGFATAKVRASAGGLNGGNYNDKKQMHDWYFIFMGAGESAIASPFSEMIPLTTIRKSIEYSREVGGVLAMQAEEAISEGLAINLALLMAQERNIPNGATHVQNYLNGLAAFPEYRFVPQAAEWIRQNGIQNGFDLYMDSPAKFMTVIKANSL